MRVAKTLDYLVYICSFIKEWYSSIGRDIKLKSWLSTLIKCHARPCLHFPYSSCCAVGYCNAGSMLKTKCPQLKLYLASLIFSQNQLPICNQIFKFSLSANIYCDSCSFAVAVLHLYLLSLIQIKQIYCNKSIQVLIREYSARIHKTAINE